MLANSSRVVLPLRTRLEPTAQTPHLVGILVSQAKQSGHCQQSFIELGAPGLPRPFRGERWCYEWRNDGENLIACWLGFPNVFFSGGIDPQIRVSVEALGRYGKETSMLRSLSRIAISIKAGTTDSGAGASPWIPENTPKAYPAL